MVKGTPIILVPPGETATITMWNAKVSFCLLPQPCTLLPASYSLKDICILCDVLKQNPSIAVSGSML